MNDKIKDHKERGEGFVELDWLTMGKNDELVFDEEGTLNCEILDFDIVAE